MLSQQVEILNEELRDKKILLELKEKELQNRPNHRAYGAIDKEVSKDDQLGLFYKIY